MLFDNKFKFFFIKGDSVKHVDEFTTLRYWSKRNILYRTTGSYVTLIQDNKVIHTSNSS